MVLKTVDERHLQHCRQCGNSAWYVQVAGFETKLLIGDRKRLPRLLDPSPPSCLPVAFLTCMGCGLMVLHNLELLLGVHKSIDLGVASLLGAKREEAPVDEDRATLSTILPSVTTTGTTNTISVLPLKVQLCVAGGRAFIEVRDDAGLRYSEALDNINKGAARLLAKIEDR